MLHTMMSIIRAMIKKTRLGRRIRTCHYPSRPYSILTIIMTMILLLLGSLNADASCVDVSGDLGYCSGIVTYDVDDSINVTAAEVVALANYRSDRDLFTPNPDLACTDQQPNVAICANCLSERRAYWCYASFPKCVSDVANKQSICRHVCERNNIKCGTSEDCSLLSDSDCAAGFFTGYLSRSLHIYGLGVFTIRLDMALATILSLCLCYFDLFEV